MMQENKNTIEEQVNVSETTNEAANVADNNETENVQTEEQQETATPDDATLLAEANEKIAQLEDKYLRQVAEFDNYRKRTMKEKAELILNGSEKALTALLPILDDMERALKNMDTTDDVDTLKEGVSLIFQKMNKVLGTQGLKPIITENADFNTDFHEAIALIPATTDEQKGKIIDCVQTGYMLNEKVIRHAKVAVGQ